MFPWVGDRGHGCYTTALHFQSLARVRTSHYQAMANSVEIIYSRNHTNQQRPVERRIERATKHIGKDETATVALPEQPRPNLRFGSSPLITLPESVRRTRPDNGPTSGKTKPRAEHEQDRRERETLTITFS